jgi:histidinol-phosphate aminotransferase
MTAGVLSLARPEIVAMKAYSSARTEAPAEGVLLNANEMPGTLLNEGENALALSAINRYPQPQPVDIVTRLAGLYGIGPEFLLVTRGSDEGIDLLVRVFCRAGIDAILECPPGFGMYRIAAQTQGAAVIQSPRNADHDFRLDADDIIRRMDENPAIKLVFLTSPNNPSGDLVDRSVLIRILEATAGKALVIMDEAHIEFCPRQHCIDLLSRFDNLVILRTLSKAWAAAGLRCGTVIASPDIIGLLRRIIAPYPLAGPVIDLVGALLAPAKQAMQQSMIAQMLENKRRLVTFLNTQGYIRNIWPGEANFVLIRLDHAREFLDYCGSQSVVLRGFDNEPLLTGCIRISIGNTKEMDKLMSVMENWQEPVDE